MKIANDKDVLFVKWQRSDRSSLYFLLNKHRHKPVPIKNQWKWSEPDDLLELRGSRQTVNFYRFSLWKIFLISLQLTQLCKLTSCPIVELPMSHFYLNYPFYTI